MNLLITGGAGFIGTHLARRAQLEGAAVTLFDNLNPQIHGSDSSSVVRRLSSFSRIIVGDMCDRTALHTALKNQDVVVHLAAETGTGQSMYEVSRYEQVNVGGTANLFDILVNDKLLRVNKVVVASSRAIYGEGKYQCAQHGVVYPQARLAADLRAGKFEPCCPACGASCTALPTDENTLPNPSSFYGLTKLVQEQMTLLFGRTLGIDAYALRYQNVYGPGQSLKNPYTGILAVFSNLVRANTDINIFEDGEESRDFVYIDDVVEATWLCIQSSIVGRQSSINVGSGQRTTVRQVAQAVVDYFGSQSKLITTGDFREGDIRHNVADLACARELLGFQPRCHFADGLREFLDWATGQESGRVSDYDRSLNEMRAKGLMR